MNSAADRAGHLTFGRYARHVLVCAAVFVLVAGVCPFLGATRLSYAEVFGGGAGNASAAIFFEARLPRVMLAALVGAALAASGVALQALLRNALAAPYTLGISSGGAFGAVAAIHCGFTGAWLGIPAVSVAAFAGCALALGIVFAAARREGRLPPSQLLLAGVTLAFFFSAATLFLQYSSDFNQLYRIVSWQMGGFDATQTAVVVRSLPVFGAGFALLFWIARDLNALSLGDETAAGLGVNVERTRRVAFVAASLLTGAAVSLAGPIGFVGLIVPHALRMAAGADNRLLLPGSMLLGGAFLAACDTLARSQVLSENNLPVGILTAFCGGPFFLWLLRRSVLE